MRLKKLFFLPSLADMLFLSIFLYLSLCKGMALLGDGDTGYHIRAGEWILSHLSVPRQDMFSFHTPAMPWTAHEWLSEVIMALVHHMSGLTAIVVFFSFLLALTFYLLFKMVRNEDGNILVAVFVMLLATAASQVHWLARPHVFSLLLLVLWYQILEEYRNGTRKRLYLLPLIMLFWVNLHGGYLAGFMLLGIYLAGELPACLSRDAQDKSAALLRLKHLFATMLICIPVACLNPYGYNILLFPFNLVSNKLIMDHVSEFMSPNFHEPSPFKYLLLLLITILAASRKRLSCKDLLLLLVFLNMSLYSVRYITLFAIIAAPILVRQIDILINESHGRFAEALKLRSQNLEKIDTDSGGILWPSVSVLSVAAAVSLNGIHYEFDPQKNPVAAVRYLEKANLKGHMFNNDEFGDYLIYASWPSYKVFFDGRIDMYGKERLKEYIKIKSFEEEWEKTIDKYGIKWIIYNTDSQFVRHLKESNDWKLIYQDKVASIFAKEDKSNKLNIRKSSF